MGAPAALTLPRIEAPRARPETPWVVFCSYVALSLAFSWPLGAFPDALVTRHFDVYPSIWLVDRAREAFPALQHDASAWPYGESLARVDSYVLLLLGWLGGGVLGAQRLVAFLGVLGPAIGAFAAEHTAHRTFHVARPWSWIAGCAYGFSGIAATALLEGHVHHVVNPWLPLLLASTWRATEPNGTRHAVLAGVWWTLGLFTSAYFGVVGALLVGAITVHAVFFPVLSLRRPQRLLPTALIAVASGALYLRIFNLGGRFSDGQGLPPDLLWDVGSVTMEGLGGWSGLIDTRMHSISAPVGFTGFWLMLFAPIVLRERRAWRMLWFLAFGALALALGRAIRITLGDPGWPSPVQLVLGLPGLEWFRFPARFAWIYALCGGIVAARVAAELAIWRPRLAVGLLVLCAGDAVVGTGLPWRLRQHASGTPSAYAAAPSDRVVLDLYPAAADRSSVEVELWTRALSCYYQAGHDRPILEVCIGTGVDSPREQVTGWLTAALLAPDPDHAAVRETLARLGVGAVALHADFYRPGDREGLAVSLGDMLGPPAAESVDAGEHVILWKVPGEGAPDAAVARATLVSLGR